VYSLLLLMFKSPAVQLHTLRELHRELLHPSREEPVTFAAAHMQCFVELLTSPQDELRVSAGNTCT